MADDGGADASEEVASAAGAPSVVVGIGAALAAPALAVLGLFLWDEYWSGSPFALNLFKCTLATFLYLGGLFAAESLGLNDLSFLAERAAMLALCATSLLGIVIGDNMWLTSMTILGPRRLILLDSLKPFLAAAMAGALLHESTPPLALLAMLVSVAGVAVVSLDRQNATREHHGRAPTCTLATGYTFAVLNMVFDVIGSVITKQYAGHFGPWAIGVFRYGFASATMLCVYGACVLRDAFRGRGARPRGARSAAMGMGELDDELQPLADAPELGAQASQNALVADAAASSVGGAGDDESAAEDKPMLARAERVIRRAAESTALARALAKSDSVPSALSANGVEVDEERGSVRNGQCARRAMPRTAPRPAKQPQPQQSVPAIGRTRSELDGSSEDAQPLLEHGGSLGASPTAGRASVGAAVAASGAADELVDGGDAELGDEITLSAAGISGDSKSGEDADAWHRMPKQPARDWFLVCLGVVFVTFMSMALNNVSLFAIPLGLNLTLQSLGPVYAIPLACVLEGEQISVRTLLASFCAVAGAAAFCQLTPLAEAG